MKYLVQAILMDGGAERPTESLKTDNFPETLAFLMKRHKTSSSYRYVVMEIATQKILVNTTENREHFYTTTED